MYEKNKYQVIKNVALNDEVQQLTFLPIKSRRFDFVPGQHLTLSTSARGLNLHERPFSITSSPSEKDILQISFKKYGDYTHKLASLLEDDIVEIGGPYGDFELDTRYPNITLLAGGIGITPFISMARYAADKTLNNKITLIYSGRSIGNTAFLSELVELQKRNPNFKFFVHLTEEPNLEITNIYHNTRLTARDLQQYINSIDRSIFYVCGPSAFTQSMRYNLTSLGVRDKQIMTEEFAISPPNFLPREKKSTWLTASMATLVMLLSLYFIYQSAQKKINASTTPTFQSTSSSVNTPASSSSSSSNTATPSNQSVSTPTSSSFQSTTNQNNSNNYQPRTRMS